MKPKPPLFLAPTPYRRRRLHDAARLLPLAGAFLLLLPILWAPGASESRDTGPDGLYLFGIWALLIAAAVALAGRLTASGDTDGDAPEEGED